MTISSSIAEDEIYECSHRTRSEQVACFRRYADQHDSARYAAWVTFFQRVPDVVAELVGDECASHSGHELSLLRCMRRTLRRHQFAGHDELADLINTLDQHTRAWGRLVQRCRRAVPEGERASCGTQRALPRGDTISPMGAGSTDELVATAGPEGQRSQGESLEGVAGSSFLGTSPEGSVDGSNDCDFILNRQTHSVASCAADTTSSLGLDSFRREIGSLFEHLDKQDYFALLRMRLAQVQSDALLEGLVLANRCSDLARLHSPPACRTEIPGVSRHISARKATYLTSCRAEPRNRQEILFNHVAVASRRHQLRCQLGALRALDASCLRFGSEMQTRTNWPRECSVDIIAGVISRTAGMTVRSATGHLITRIAPDGCPHVDEISAAERLLNQEALNHPQFGAADDLRLERLLLSTASEADKLRAIRQSHSRIADQIRTDLAHTCDPGFDSTQLVHLRPIAQSVVNSAPWFSDIDACFQRSRQAATEIGSAIQSMTRLCSLLLFIPTPPTAALGVTCMAYELGATSAEYLGNTEYVSLAQSLAQTLGHRALSTSELEELRHIQSLVGDIRSQVGNLALVAVLGAVARSPDLLPRLRIRLQTSVNPSQELRVIASEIETAGPVREARISAAPSGGRQSARARLRERIVSRHGEQALERVPCFR